MKFRFEVNLTQDDYLEYNRYTFMETAEGKKNLRKLRIMTILMLFVGIISGIINSESVVAVIIFLFIYVLFICVPFVLLMPKIYWYILKRNILKSLKSGKPLYSRNAVLEFYDDFFVEYTPEEKTEVRYNAIEKICFVNNRYIYMYKNQAQAYIIPLYLFPSKAEFDNFAGFLNFKCSNIEYH